MPISAQPPDTPLFYIMTKTAILSATRTPIGGFQGELASLTAPQLGAIAIDSAITRAGVDAEGVDSVVFGTVLAAGQGQAPARQAARFGGLADHAECTTINKMCGSGMKAVMLAHDALLARSATLAVAGGMESMSNTPHIVPRARQGYRLGHGELLDHMYRDGLEDAYQPEKLMGHFADDTARHYQFSRSKQDDFAIASLERALKAQQAGWFQEEITPVDTKTRKSTVTIFSDEQPRNARTEKIPHLKPVFVADGTVTAANSSSISDGASAIVMCHEHAAENHTPIAYIIGHATHAKSPAWFTTAPIQAIEKVLDRVGWQTKDVDLFEINEAFATVTLAAMHDLGLPHDIVNVHGGACALGHPVGASGARIITTLIYALQRLGGKRGVAALCIGGGEATAIAIELA